VKEGFVFPELRMGAMGEITSQPILLVGSYDYRLLGLSFVLSVCTCYAGLELNERILATRERRRWWLACSAGAIGIGLWASQQVGIQAFSLAIPVRYHYPTQLVALLLAMATVFLGLSVASRDRIALAEAIGFSVPVGIGMAAVSFLEVASRRMAASVEHHWALVAISGVLAIVIFWSVIVVFAAKIPDRKHPGFSGKITGSVLLGAGLTVLPYLTMESVRLRESDLLPDVLHTVARSSVEILSITAAAFLTLAGAVVFSALERLLQSQEAAVERAHENETFFHRLAEAIPGIVWTARGDGVIDFASEQWYRYTGQTPQPDKRAEWKKAVHPDDVSVCMAKWEQCIRTGELYEMEYRLRSAADDTYRWFLTRATPVRDEQQGIVKWVGSLTDIEDQKHHQQVLEQQVRERTEELADANTRLHEEMWEKDLARRRLDEQNEQMMRELTERSQRATLLAKMGELLQSCVTKEEVFQAALGFAPKIFPTSRGAMALLNPSRSLAEVAGSWQECEIPATVFEPSSCWALRTSHPHLVVAGDKTARCTHADGVKGTYLCIPIMAQGEALGILHFQATEHSPSLADAELSFRTTFAGQVGLSLANIRLREALRTQSIRDPLTGLYNRRHLGEMLERETRRASRAGHGLGIMMLDLDHFKKFNDTYGHEAGDTVLREAASLLAKSVRAEDIVCRFGGEEFVIILPMADIKASQARAERIRAKVRELSIVHQGQSLGTVTVSVGVAALPDHGTSSKDLLEAADAALYRAKREGRDRVVVSEAVIPPERADAAAQAGSG